MTLKQKLMTGCFVIGLVFIVFTISAFSAEYGRGGPSYSYNYREYLTIFLVGVGFWVVGLLAFLVQKVRGKWRRS